MGDAFPLPEPIRQAMEEAARKADAAVALNDAKSHEVIGWVLTLPSDGASAMRDLLYALNADVRHHETLLAGRIIGLLEMKLATEVGRCPVCGQNHDEILAAMAHPEEQQP